MESLAGQRLFFFGRLHGITRRRLTDLVDKAGGSVTKHLSPKTTHVVFAHMTAPLTLVNAPPLALPDGVPGDAVRLSELQFRRRIGLAGAPAQEVRAFSRDHLLRQLGLTAALVECLELYDVLEPVGTAYSYRDLASAREAVRLLERGLALDEIVAAAAVIRRRGLRLCEAHLTEAPWGSTVQELGGTLMELDGQFTLPLGEAPCHLYDILADAERYESLGDMASAARLYRIAIGIDRTDPVLPFNLGNVLDAQGFAAEAILSYRRALACAPDFADAWYNLAIIYGRLGRTDESVVSYRKALEANPDYEDALYNLAMLLTQASAYGEALALWERFLALAPPGDLTQARRSALLCRLEIASAKP
jgi:tetratricopeptide (TPR) repeat protein